MGNGKFFIHNDNLKNNNTCYKKILFSINKQKQNINMASFNLAI